MKIKRHIALLLGVLFVFGPTGCNLSIMTELLNDRSKLAEPVLVFSVAPEKLKVFSKTFSIQYPGRYVAELITDLKNEEIERYNLPDTNINLVGEISIYGESSKFIKHTFDIDWPHTTIARVLFVVKAPNKIPLKKNLTVEVVLSTISDNFLELYSSITIAMTRHGILYE